MYTLLIVDDEPKDRSIVKILINKQYAGIFEIIESENGKQALEILASRHIDLMLLDMNMPVLTGIDVLEQNTIPTYTIILTAYSYFDYAQSALKHGVRDYVLKPPIRSELYSAIDKFLKNAEESSNLPMHGRDLLEQELSEQLLFFGNSEKIDDYLKILNLTSTTITIAVLTALPAKLSVDSDDFHKYLVNAIPSVHVITHALQDLTAFLIFCRKPVDAEEVRVLIQQYRKNGIFQIEFESLSSEYAQKFPSVFSSLRKAENSRNYDTHVTDHMEELERMLLQQNFSGAMKIIIKEIHESSASVSIDTTKLSLISALSSISRRVFVNADRRGSYAKLSLLLSADDPESLQSSAAEYIKWLISEMQNISTQNTFVINRVTELVCKDCSQNWNIEKLAASFKMSPYYLSHLFKKNIGCSFTDYLANKRIDKAIELMRNPELSLSEIGETVGYADQNYFSRVFKKRMGINARQYRHQMFYASNEN